MANKSGLRFHFRVWMDESEEPTHDFHTIPFDTTMAERKFGKTVEELMENTSSEVLTFICYTAGHRLKLFPEQKCDDWARNLQDFEAVDDDADEDAADPTPAATRLTDSES